MSSVNKVILVGNVGQTPDIRTTQNGQKIANLSVATSESWKDKSSGERKERTEWHRVSVYNDGIVRVIESYVKKGDKVYIEGQLETRKWTDKDGQEKYTTEVALRQFGGNLVMLTTQGQKHDYKTTSDVSGRDALDELLDDTIPF